MARGSHVLLLLCLLRNSTILGSQVSALPSSISSFSLLKILSKRMTQGTSMHLFTPLCNTSNSEATEYWVLTVNAVDNCASLQHFLPWFSEWPMSSHGNLDKAFTARSMAQTLSIHSCQNGTAMLNAQLMVHRQLLVLVASWTDVSVKSC